VAISAEDTGSVVDLDAQDHDALLALKLAIDDRGKDARVDIAAAQDKAHLATAEMPRIGQQQRKSRRSGTLGNRL
jgi:hypothetical protein